MNKHELIEDLEKNIYCRVQASPVHGVGVFAVRDIPKGVNPFVGRLPAPWKKISYNDVMENQNILPQVKEYVKAMYPIQDGIIYMPNHSLNAIGVSYYINHSDTPNLGGPVDDPEFTTLRDIKKGEELFADYTTYTDE